MVDLVKARHFKALENQMVECQLCPNLCKIHSGHGGRCLSRRNIEGTLYAENYGKITSIAIDPIEKKPLYHFYPFKSILSIGTYGCNMDCQFCQNWHIAQEDHSNLPRVNMGELEDKGKSIKDNIGFAFTYNEPTVWFEFVYDMAKRSKEIGLKNVLVTNGFISREPLMELLPLIDAMNIDVKGFTGDFYKRICKALYDSVKETVEISAKKCHVEITSLIIPGENDTEDEFSNHVKWIADIDKNIPLHISRYFPNYKYSKPPTPIKTLQSLQEIAMKRLNYVYIGNVGNVNNTLCPKCRELVIDRGEKRILLDGNLCPSCDYSIKVTI